MNPSAKTAPAEKATSCRARRPILNKDENVLGYELLFGESSEKQRCSSDFGGGTGSIIDTLNIKGRDTVCDGRRAFIDCTHDVLRKEFYLLLPAEKAAVEIQDTVPSMKRTAP